MKKAVPTEFTNMIMIEDGENVLVQERRLYWKGIAFPGGHVEPGESFLESAVREVREETGLSVTDLRLCGTVDWEDTETGERYVVLLYRTSAFAGELLPETEEGRVFWMRRTELPSADLCPNFEMYLRVFFEEDKTEFHGTHHGDGPRTRRVL